MPEQLPLYIPLLFICTTLLTIGLFSRAAGYNRTAWMLLLSWSVLQGIIGYSQFYRVTDAMPPRFLLLVGPPLLLILVLFLSAAGKRFTGRLDARWLTYLHVVRIPVEIVLLALYLHGQVPQLITFEGRNFDVLSGLSAPLVAYYGYQRPVLGKTFLVIWNVVCLLLLLNVVVTAVLSAPFRFQQFAFDQPNRAILCFPFLLLPGCIVPLVLYAHLATLRQLWRPGVATNA